MPRHLTILCIIVLLSSLAASCAEDPAGPGQRCDSSADEPCQSGLECADNGEGQTTCQRPQGADCDPAEEPSACLFGTSCVAGEVPEGESEAPTQCLIPLGSECDLAADPSHCAGGGVCVDFAEGEPAMEGEEVATDARCALPEDATCDPANDFCSPGLLCAERVDGTYACHPRFYIEGVVRDATDDAAIEGAHVLGLNEESVAVTDIAVTDAGGRYQLEVPSVRETDGKPVDASYTLRASAQDYQTFPGGVRTALPINTASEVSKGSESWTIAGTITDITLIPVQDMSTARYTISGTVRSDENQGGVLVVSEGSDSAITAVSSSEGTFTIFNVPDGDYTIKGYAADLQLEPASVTVSGEDLEGVDLNTSDVALVTVEGSIQIVNPGDGDQTSVVLAVASTFNEGFGRGEVPAGLRAPRTGPVSVDGSWEITGVPAGEYIILAAFENDRLVRDPDTNISGTDTLSLSVTGSEEGARISLADSFKVTGALKVVSPGAELPEALSSPPMLEWEDDSSESFYTVDVYNSYGELVWETRIEGVSGSDTVTVQYDGPFEAGIYYQFRATSWRSPGGNDAPISRTEDLLGVFQAAP